MALQIGVGLLRAVLLRRHVLMMALIKISQKMSFEMTHYFTMTFFTILHESLTILPAFCSLILSSYDLRRGVWFLFGLSCLRCCSFIKAWESKRLKKFHVVFFRGEGDGRYFHVSVCLWPLWNWHITIQSLMKQLLKPFESEFT